LKECGIELSQNFELGVEISAGIGNDVLKTAAEIRLNRNEGQKLDPVKEVFYSIFKLGDNGILVIKRIDLDCLSEDGYEFVYVDFKSSDFEVKHRMKIKKGPTKASHSNVREILRQLTNAGFPTNMAQIGALSLYDGSYDQ
jgi:hypothetical protein